MKISVRAKPGAKKKRIIELDSTHFTVAVQEPPREGRANAAIVRAIAEHFGVPASRVRMISGLASRNKIIDVKN